MQEAFTVRPKVLILDVYETLLDMSDVEKKVNNLLDSGKGYMLWFEMFMEYCFVDNSIRQFHSFADIARATMEMVGQKLGRTITDGDLEYVIELMKHLPVHENVQQGLSLLNDHGFRIAALTNAPESVVCERMERTGLISYFEKVLSAEQVKKYKPSLEVYEWAAQKLNVKCSEALMVSSHGWDVAGATAVGMETALLKQSKRIFFPLAAKPDLVCTSLMDLAQQLIAIPVVEKENVR